MSNRVQTYLHLFCLILTWLLLSPNEYSAVTLITLINKILVTNPSNRFWYAGPQIWTQTFFIGTRFCVLSFQPEQHPPPPPICVRPLGVLTISATRKTSEHCHWRIILYSRLNNVIIPNCTTSGMVRIHGNALELHSGRARFECRPWHQIFRGTLLYSLVPRVGHSRYVPKSLQFSTDHSSYHSTVYNPRYWQRRKVNHKNIGGMYVRRSWTQKEAYNKPNVCFEFFTIIFVLTVPDLPINSLFRTCYGTKRECVVCNLLHESCQYHYKQACLNFSNSLLKPKASRLID
jgi:hypothetical protein